MTSDNFYSQDFNAEEEEYAGLLDKFLKAEKNDGLSQFKISEDEAIFIIDKLSEQLEMELARKAAEIAFERFPYNTDIILKYCDLLIVSSKHIEALSIMDKFIGVLGKFTETDLLYARCYIREKKFDKARLHIENVIESEYDVNEIKETYCSLAIECMDVENYLEALEYFNRAELRGKLSLEYYNDIAFCYDFLGNQKEAVKYYNLYLDDDPFNELVWFNLGTLYAKQRKFDEAIEAFEYSLALAPKNDASIHNLAVVYLNTEKWTEALALFERFIALDDKNVVGYMGAADACISMGNFERAKILFLKVLTLKPGDADATNGLECMGAVEEYKNGNLNVFMSKIEEIANNDKTWLISLVKGLPELSKDKKFLKFLKEYKITGKN